MLWSTCSELRNDCTAFTKPVWEQIDFVANRHSAAHERMLWWRDTYLVYKSNLHSRLQVKFESWEAMFSFRPRCVSTWWSLQQLYRSTAPISTFVCFLFLLQPWTESCSGVHKAMIDSKVFAESKEKESPAFNQHPDITSLPFFRLRHLQNFSIVGLRPQFGIWETWLGLFWGPETFTIFKLATLVNAFELLNEYFKPLMIAANMPAMPYQPPFQDQSCTTGGFWLI